MAFRTRRRNRRGATINVLRGSRRSVVVTAFPLKGLVGRNWRNNRATSNYTSLASAQPVAPSQPGSKSLGLGDGWPDSSPGRFAAS